ncbi:hypothetical protein ElP_63660 [Tautonia plasticadhaerens]|uniref:Uncharacterized protein n=1 Tax=Tautonia plasticadhaerens TaxID=2527974 RepID=A0A518HC35_9BACT|nr:hypothetical protein ElP_63660 [Tautonia plasticadhaerens]
MRQRGRRRRRAELEQRPAEHGHAQEFEPGGSGGRYDGGDRERLAPSASQHGGDPDHLDAEEGARQRVDNDTEPPEVGPDERRGQPAHREPDPECLTAPGPRRRVATPPEPDQRRAAGPVQRQGQGGERRGKPEDCEDPGRGPTAPAELHRAEEDDHGVVAEMGAVQHQGQADRDPSPEDHAEGGSAPSSRRGVVERGPHEIGHPSGDRRLRGDRTSRSIGGASNRSEPSSDPRSESEHGPGRAPAYRRASCSCNRASIVLAAVGSGRHAMPSSTIFRSQIPSGRSSRGCGRRGGRRGRLRRSNRSRPGARGGRGGSCGGRPGSAAGRWRRSDPPG